MSDIPERIEEVLLELPDNSRAEFRSRLQEICADSGNPTLALLEFIRLSKIESRRLKAEAEKTAAARGEEFAKMIWSLERWKWRNLIFSWFLSGTLGAALAAGCVWIAASKWPNKVQAGLRLPQEIQAVHDWRNAKLDELGLNWTVVEKTNFVAIVVEGKTAPQWQASGHRGIITFDK
jgi:hypothetical protein